jgi:hypothetical protein
MESIENSMDPRSKEKHEEEHEDSKKEREARTTSHCIENQKITILTCVDIMIVAGGIYLHV